MNRRPLKKIALITGSSGLVGSEAVSYFDERGWIVEGVDNNMRKDFFGPDGDTSLNLQNLLKSTKNFSHHALDIRDRDAIKKLIENIRPNLIIHAASQPSHDLARERPFDDFEINAVGTLNLLEWTRRFCPEASFIFLSTNKVYGDSPNEKELVELETRWDYASPEDYDGIDEQCPVDASLHSLFGASKLAADILVQEYGRYFGMSTACLRCGCITGSRHSGAELHGFLAYLARAVREGRTYRIFGYKGKQVRDNIHPRDICRFVEQFWERPRPGAVYNLGGGRHNSISVLEAIDRFQQMYSAQIEIEYVDEPRRGDHICYISDLSRVRSHYPEWRVERSLDSIFEELGAAVFK